MFSSKSNIHVFWDVLPMCPNKRYLCVRSIHRGL